MANLDFTREKSMKMSAMEDEAIEVITNVLKGNREIDEVVKTARNVLSITSKNRQTLTAREGIRFSAASTILTDPNDLEKYVNASMPQIKKALTGS